MYEKKLILDTCALLWLASGDKALSDKARASIEQASIVFVSAISAWEVSLKFIQKKLILPIKPELWFPRVLVNHNLTLVGLDVDILMGANNLPQHHKDPADRFIIATALREKASVVTSDAKFKEYKVKVMA